MDQTTARPPVVLGTVAGEGRTCPSSRVHGTEGDMHLTIRRRAMDFSSRVAYYEGDPDPGPRDAFRPGSQEWTPV